MSKDEERIKRVFPKCFENFVMPEGAKEESITVYRACKTRKCDHESFLPSYVEIDMNSCADLSDPGLYSVSTYEKPNHIRRFVTTNSEYGKPYTIALGSTDPSCGLAQRTKERKSKSRSHVDWWLYEGAKPYIFFEIIDFNKHLEEYRKEN